MTSSILNAMMKPGAPLPDMEHTAVHGQEGHNDDIVVVEKDEDTPYDKDPPPPYEDNTVSLCRDCMFNTIGKYASILKTVVYALLLITYTVYFAFALKFSVDMATSLIVLTSLVLLCLFYIYIRDHFGSQIYKHCLQPIDRCISRHWDTIKWYF